MLKRESWKEQKIERDPISLILVSLHCLPVKSISELKSFYSHTKSWIIRPHGTVRRSLDIIPTEHFTLRLQAYLWVPGFLKGGRAFSCQWNQHLVWIQGKQTLSLFLRLVLKLSIFIKFTVRAESGDFVPSLRYTAIGIGCNAQTNLLLWFKLGMVVMPFINNLKSIIPQWERIKQCKSCQEEVFSL